MNRNIPLPVLIEDLIKKVTDKKKSVEERQHYATSLRHISDAIGSALSQFDKEYKDYFRK